MFGGEEEVTAVELVESEQMIALCKFLVFEDEIESVERFNWRGLGGESGSGRCRRGSADTFAANHISIASQIAARLR